MKITGKLKIKMNGAVWNVRSEPNSTSAIIGKTVPNEEFTTTEIEMLGQVIDGNSCWSRYGAGWVSMGQIVSCATLGDDTQCQIELAKVKVENVALQAELNKFTPITYYEKSA